MSNKASDKNVANVEDDVKILKEFIDYAQEVIDDMEYERPVDVTVYQKDLTSMQNILAEREQDKKRIKELEEENTELKKYNKTVGDRIVEYKKNSIPKQAVIDKIKNMEELKSKYEKELEEPYQFLLPANSYYRRQLIEVAHKIDVLQELLEGEK